MDKRTFEEYLRSGKIRPRVSDPRKGANPYLGVYKQGERGVPYIDPLEVMSKSASLYSYGLGGLEPWTKQEFIDPQSGSIKTRPVLKQGYVNVGQGATLDSRPIMGIGPTLAPAGKKVAVMPAGSSSRQEYRGIKDAYERMGATVLEAPEKFVIGKGTSEKDRASQFYSTVTGRPMGTLMGTGSYGGFGAGKEIKPQPTQLSSGFGDISPRQDPALTKATKITEKFGLKTGDPISHTGFGQIAQTQAAEETLSPFGEGLSNVGTNLFGAPRFPFVGANSVFERASQYAPLGVPRFPFAGYNPFIY